MKVFLLETGCWEHLYGKRMATSGSLSTELICGIFVRWKILKNLNGNIPGLKNNGRIIPIQRVQEMFDVPYDANPAPSKIPGGALEFNISSLGETESVELNLKNALCVVKWKNGSSLETCVNAVNPIGWFRFEGVEKNLIPELITPAYNIEGESAADNSLTGQDLRRLGYPRGEVIREGNSITYEQEGWGGFRYQINVRWRIRETLLRGAGVLVLNIPDGQHR